jgi:hypothetical protein
MPLKVTMYFGLETFVEEEKLSDNNLNNKLT